MDGKSSKFIDEVHKIINIKMFHPLDFDKTSLKYLFFIYYG